MSILSSKYFSAISWLYFALILVSIYVAQTPRVLTLYIHNDMDIEFEMSAYMAPILRCKDIYGPYFVSYDRNRPYFSGLLHTFLPRKPSKKKSEHERNESPAAKSPTSEHAISTTNIPSPCNPIAASDDRYGITRSPSNQPKPKPRSQRTPMILTYALSPTKVINYIDRTLVEAALARAFERYAQVVPVFFLKVEDYPDADVKVGFYSEDEDEDCKKIAESTKDRVIAHASWKQDGQIHLNTAERWTVDLKKDKSRKAMDLETVMVHEIGHVLGLSHSSSKESVMYAYQSVRRTNVDLKEEDIKELQAKYVNFHNVRKPNWKILTVAAYFNSSSRFAGGGFILWDGARNMITAQSFPLSWGSTASARFEACCHGLNFLKMQKLEKVLLITDCVITSQSCTGDDLELRGWLLRTLRFTGDALKLSEWLVHEATDIRLQNRYREGLVASAELAKKGTRFKMTWHKEDELPESAAAVLDREGRMLRHLPSNAFPK